MYDNIDMDQSITSTRVNMTLFKNEKIVQLAMGNYHALLVTDAGVVFGWGSNFLCALGRYNRSDIFAVPAPLHGMRNVSMVTVGMYHSMLLGNVSMENGNSGTHLYSIGSNRVCKCSINQYILVWTIGIGIF